MYLLTSIVLVLWKGSAIFHIYTVWFSHVELADCSNRVSWCSLLLFCLPHHVHSIKYLVKERKKETFSCRFGIFWIRKRAQPPCELSSACTIYGTVPSPYNVSCGKELGTSQKTSPATAKKEEAATPPSKRLSQTRPTGALTFEWTGENRTAIHINIQLSYSIYIYTCIKIQIYIYTVYTQYKYMLHNIYILSKKERIEKEAKKKERDPCPDSIIAQTTAMSSSARPHIQRRSRPISCGESAGDSGQRERQQWQTWAALPLWQHNVHIVAAHPPSHPFLIVEIIDTVVGRWVRAHAATGEQV